MLTERKNKIMDILSKKKTISNEDLSKELFCSISTLRRDLIELERAGQVSRYHGGVTIVDATNSEYNYLSREKSNTKEKSYLTSLAVPFINEGDSLFLDSSSTVLELCQYLESFNHLIVVTNGVKTALTLSTIDNLSIYIAGGEIKNNSSSAVGELASNFLTNFRADILFLSCRGLDENGVYEASLSQALIKQKMIKNAKKVVLCVDSSKMNSPHFFNLTSYEDIDVILTNEKPSKKLLTAFDEHDCDVYY